MLFIEETFATEPLHFFRRRGENHGSTTFILANGIEVYSEQSFSS